MQIRSELEPLFKYRWCSGLSHRRDVISHTWTHRRCPTAAAAPPSCDPSWALWGRSPLRWWLDSAGRRPGGRTVLWWTFCRLPDRRWPKLWAGAHAALLRLRARVQNDGKVMFPIMGSAWERVAKCEAFDRWQIWVHAWKKRRLLTWTLIFGEELGTSSCK